MKYAEIVLPLPLAQTYTYAVPDEMQDEIAVGMRVVVHFGARKFYTGIVSELHDRTAAGRLKAIELLLDARPLVLPSQLHFWQQLSDYYRAPLGDLYRAALPTGLKLESETVVTLADRDDTEFTLSKKEALVYDFLSDRGTLTPSEINRLGDCNLMPSIQRLLEKGLVVVNEALSQDFKPKQITLVAAAVDFGDEAVVEQALQLIKRAKKQQELLHLFFDLSSASDDRRVERSALMAHGDYSAALRALVERGLIRLESRQVSRLASGGAGEEAHPLSEAQQQAFEGINSDFENRDTILLHGVTSSGKTEIYLHLIEQAIRQGKQVLYLVPEIGLTTQLTMRLNRVLGDRMRVYHSRFSDNERIEVWQSLLNDNAPSVVLGVRSSVFLPFKNLGLIIVDEEHDASYKQYDPSPRYNARHAALFLAQLHGAKTLLGSATPSVESYCLALQQRFGLVELSQRYGDIRLPEIDVVDLKESYRKKRMKGHFSLDLIDAVNRTLAAGEQVILFQNRRGYSPFVQCPSCAWVPRCIHCDVSLTYHKAFNKLTCHYCGYTIAMPERCPECGTTDISPRGFGTEQIEDEVKQLFPDQTVQRMDLDTTRRKQAFQQIITDFEQRRVAILVGTQMVTKGLDFESVGLVGILNADNLLNYPDFRAHERAFQMLAQVSGRAGRKHRQGRVVLQTSSPDNPVIKEVVAADYRHFFDRQMSEREAFNYPPYCRLVQIVVKHHDSSTLNRGAWQLAEQLRKTFGARVLGPDNPPVGRIQNQYIKHILLKIEVTASAERAKQLIDETALSLRRQADFKGLTIYLDVDPM